MKTKNIIRISIALIFAGMLTSCSSTYQSASSFGKRKYLKGNFNDNAGSAEKVAATNSATPSTTSTPVVANTPAKQAPQQEVKKNITGSASVVAVANTPVKESFTAPAKKANKTAGLNLTAPTGGFNLPDFLCIKVFSRIILTQM